jgi:hypothetical protein
VPAIKNVLKHVRVEEARAKRKCGRKPREHVIKKGDKCLVVQNGQEAPNYCIQCATEILSLAQANLNAIRSSLTN